METTRISLEAIDFDPNQPRKEKPDEYISELGKSIASRGLKQPITVRVHPENADRFMVNMGECRTRASQKAGLLEIDAFVSGQTSENEVFLDQLLENITRLDMTPMEEIEGCHRAMLMGTDDDDITIGKLANALGKSVAVIQKDLGLVNLPPIVKKAIDAGELPKIVAYELVNIEDAKVLTAYKWAMKNPKNAKTMLSGITAYVQENSQTELFSQTAKNTANKDIKTARGASKRLEKIIASFSKKWGHGDNLRVLIISRKKDEDLAKVELTCGEMKRVADKMLATVQAIKAEGQKNVANG